MQVLKLKIVSVLVSLTCFKQFFKTARVCCRDSRHPGIKHEVDRGINIRKTQRQKINKVLLLEKD